MNAAADRNYIKVLKPALTNADVDTIIRRRHSLGGKILMGKLEMLNRSIGYVPYLMSDIVYYRRKNQLRRCFVFENMDNGLRHGVMDVENLDYILEEKPVSFEEIDIDEEAYKKEITTYCKLDLLVKNYRKFIDWHLDIRSIEVIYRKETRVSYELNGKGRNFNVYMDGLNLK